VADSYAQNGNANVVRQRLQGFDLSQVVTEVESLASQSETLGLAGQSARLRSLAAAINRGEAGTVTGQPLATVAAAAATAGSAPTLSAAAKGAAATATASATEASSRVPSDWIIIGAFGLLAAALVVWVVQRRRLSRAVTSTVPTSEKPVTSAPSATSSPRPQGVASAPSDRLQYVTLNETARIEFHSDSSDSIDLRIFDAAAVSQTKTVVGQVDLRVAEILRPDPTQLPAALELRLFDRRAARTVVAVLVSAEAYTDPTARQLVGTLPNNVIKPAIDVSRTGRTIELETRNLRLQAEIEDVQFLPATPYPTFNELVLKVTPMPNSEPPEVIDGDYTLAPPDGEADDAADEGQQGAASDH